MTPSEKLAFTTETFDAEYLIQISNNDKVLVTIGIPAGGHDITEFSVWKGDGLIDGTDEQADPELTRTWYSGDVDMHWLEIVRYGYQLALTLANEG